MGEQDAAGQQGAFSLACAEARPGETRGGPFCLVGRPGRAEIAHPHRMGLLGPSFVKMRDLGGYAVALSLFSVGGCVKPVASLFVFLSCDERILGKA